MPQVLQKNEIKTFEERLSACQQQIDDLQEQLGNQERNASVCDEGDELFEGDVFYEGDEDDYACEGDCTGERSEQEGVTNLTNTAAENIVIREEVYRK